MGRVADGVEAAPAPAHRIAFGKFDPWEGDIRRNLDARHAPSFVDLAEVRLHEKEVSSRVYA